MPKQVINLWTPHPRQAEALKRTEFEILFGGSRGGGKTDAGINWLIYNVANPQLRALILRRNADDLRDWIDRANYIYSKLGATMKGNPPEFHWSSGAVFRTGHLKDENAYTKYQGHEYQALLIEELTQIPNEKLYLNLLASCRSTVNNLRPQVFLTTNPGEIGHVWVKRRFVDPAPPMTPIVYTSYVRGKKITLTRVFVPATMDDNPTLIEKDPAYVARIEQLKEIDYDKYMAWRFGDWDRFAGQVFTEFNRKYHIIKPILPNRHYTHYLWIDWGYADTSAFAAYLSALIPETLEDGQKFNRVITYQEFYGNKKDPDTWAEIIYNWCKKNRIEPYIGYTDPSMHNPTSSGSQDISSLMVEKWRKLHNKKWITLEKGINTRTGRVGGVAIMHNWLSIAPDKLPYWIITENCTNLIRTLPMLVYDQNHIEDVDTTQEDHAYDASRYGLSHIRFIKATVSQFSTRKQQKPVKIFTKEGDMIGLDLSKFAIDTTKKKKGWRSHV